MHQTTEQRNYQLKVREMRNKWKGHAGDVNDSDSGGELQGNEKDRQPRLSNLTPDYDLKLFVEAQAIASEKIVSYACLCILYYIVGNWEMFRFLIYNADVTSYI